MIEDVIEEIRRWKRIVDGAPFIVYHPDDEDKIRFARPPLGTEPSPFVERGKVYLIDPSKIRGAGR